MKEIIKFLKAIGRCQGDVILLLQRDSIQLIIAIMVWNLFWFRLNRVI